MKLSKELSRRATGKTVYVLDEPTTGLHFDDIRKLPEVLQALVDQGNTVIVIEHNLDVIKTADWIIDLGLKAATAAERSLPLARRRTWQRCESHTGQFLAPYLDARSRNRRNPPDTGKQRRRRMQQSPSGKDGQHRPKLDWLSTERRTFGARRHRVVTGDRIVTGGSNIDRIAVFVETRFDLCCARYVLDRRQNKAFSELPIFRVVPNCATIPRPRQTALERGFPDRTTRRDDRRSRAGKTMKRTPIEVRMARRDEMIREAPAGDMVWVFGYGSLIWNPSLRL